MINRTGIFSYTKQFLLLLIMAVTLVGCDKTPATSIEDARTSDTTAQAIFICNEGNFQWGNASLSLYNAQTGSVQQDVYKSVNGKGVGDVLQSVCVINKEAYLVVNNSHKIEVIDAKTCKQIRSITGFNSPRYMLPINANKAYVSDLYEKAVYVVDLNTQQISGSIGIQSWTEQMELIGEKAFVCGTNSPYVYVINTQNDQLIDSIQLGYGPQYMAKDSHQKLWVMTTGKAPNPPQLFCINAKGEIEKTFSFLSQDLPARLMIAPNKSTLYWINKGVYKMSITENTLPAKALIEVGQRNFYGLGYNPHQHQIMVSDAKDFVQKSEVLIFDTIGTLKRSFLTQINSGYFYAR
ncbi:MAG: hypothetical protein SGJ00_00040 [bacterium]|nr:hypothetical protein [bacterium]